MRQWFIRLRQRLGQRSQKANLIIVGIGYPGFSLGQAVQASGCFHIVAFIDDEPWTHRTQLLGVTIRYPSELAALVDRHEVQYVVRIDGEGPAIADNIWQAVLATGVTPVTLPADSTPGTQLDQLLAAQSPAD